MGVTRGFFHAGAARVLSSLWKVDDAATAQLMGAFYPGMLKERPATGGGAAQLAIWRGTHRKSPYYWAGFAMHEIARQLALDGALAVSWSPRRLERAGRCDPVTGVAFR